jgi:hypothetical protein
MNSPLTKTILIVILASFAATITKNPKNGSSACLLRVGPARAFVLLMYVLMIYRFSDTSCTMLCRRLHIDERVYDALNIITKQYSVVRFSLRKLVFPRAAD